MFSKIKSNKGYRLTASCLDEKFLVGSPMVVWGPALLSLYANDLLSLLLLSILLHTENIKIRGAI